MKRKPYPKYKPSGVEWLGEVPEHWGVKRLKYQSTINDATLPETNDPDYELLYVDISSIDPMQGIVQKEPMIFENAPSRARRIVKSGDTILSTVRTYLRAIAPVKNPEPNLIVSTGFAVVRPNGVAPDYLSAVIRAPYFIEEVVSRSVGVSYPAINASEIGLINIPLPSLPEQQAIAAFLDRETGRIDTLIGKKKKLMELLKEKRTALISRAVTKGLDASVKLKPSGVEWLGDVPEHWGTFPLRRVIRTVKTGGTPTGAEDSAFNDDGFNWYSPSDFSESVDLSKSNRALSEEGKKEVRVFPPMTVMLVGIGATIGKVGLSMDESSCNQQINGIVCGDLLAPLFTTYYLKTMRDFIVTCGKYTTLPIINQDETKNLIITLPPHSEQQAIAAFLDRETAKIDTLVSKVETAIEKLKEYRTALISAAVTGKIDIRKEVAV